MHGLTFSNTGQWSRSTPKQWKHLQLSKPAGSLQGLKLLSTGVFQPPSDSAKLVSASYQANYLTILWSDGHLQAYNTARTTGNALSEHTSSRLRAFDAPSSHMALDSQDQHPQEPQQQPSGKKKRKSTAAAAAAAQQPLNDGATPSSNTVPMLLPLGGHALAAIREPSDLPTNGQHSTEMEITVANTQYGCIQSVTSVKLPGGGGVNGSAGAQQEALQLRSGMGDLVLLMHSTVWYISIQVGNSRIGHLSCGFSLLARHWRYLGSAISAL